MHLRKSFCRAAKVLNRNVLDVTRRVAIAMISSGGTARQAAALMIVYWYSFSNHYTRECIHTCESDCSQLPGGERYFCSGLSVVVPKVEALSPGAGT